MQSCGAVPPQALPRFASCVYLSEDTQVAWLVKKSPASARDAGDTVFILWPGRSPGRRNGDPLRYCCLRIPWTEEPGGLQTMGSQSQTQLSTHLHTSVRVTAVPKFLPALTPNSS